MVSLFRFVAAEKSRDVTRSRQLEGPPWRHLQLHALALDHDVHDRLRQLGVAGELHLVFVRHLLVIGREITSAADPLQAAEKILADLRR